MRTRGSAAQLLQGKTVAWNDLTPTKRPVGFDSHGLPRDPRTATCQHCGVEFPTFGGGAKWCSEACRLAKRAKSLEKHLATRRNRLCK